MHELSKKIFDGYQVRKTRAQKTAFIELLKESLPEYDIKIEENPRLKSRNILIGDLSSAKYILTAHYDTQPVMPFPNFLTPKNMFLYLLYNLAIIAPIIIVSLLLGTWIGNLTNIRELGLVIYLVLLIPFFGIMMFGKANQHTANDNTSGVITLLEALQDENIRKDCLFVLFDHEELGLLGSSYFAKKHKKELEGKLLLNFDCVGVGDHIMLVQSKKAKKIFGEELQAAFLPEGEKQMVFAEARNTTYPSDQKNFKCAVGIASFKKKRFVGYYMNKIHTRYDTTLDEKNINLLIKCLQRLCA